MDQKQSNFKEQTKTRYQPGGTASVICNKWISKVTANGSDPAGIWPWISLAGENTQKVMIISAYWVCTNSLDNAGSSTAWLQQWKYCRSINQQDLDTRELFNSNLHSFFEKQIMTGYEIILSLGANEEDTDGSKLWEFYDNLTL
eukprot:9225172-Ditylum_brightwellii.AAC.1